MPFSGFLFNRIWMACDESPAGLGWRRRESRSLVRTIQTSKSKSDNGGSNSSSTVILSCMLCWKLFDFKNFSEVWKSWLLPCLCHLSLQVILYVAKNQSEIRRDSTKACFSEIHSLHHQKIRFFIFSTCLDTYVRESFDTGVFSQKTQCTVTQCCTWDTECFH